MHQCMLGKEDKQVKQHYYVTSSQKLYYNMTMPAKNSRVIIRSVNFYHTLVMCYHVNCSISYLASDIW